MKANTLLKFFSIIVAITILSACTQLDKTISSEKPLALPFINKNGELVIVNARTGEVISACDDSAKSKNKKKPCKGPTEQDLTDLVINNSGDKYNSVLTSGNKVEVIGESTITIIRFKGSDCVTIWDWGKARWKTICN